MRRRRTTDDAPLSVYAEDWLERGERTTLGDREAAEVAWERHHRAELARPARPMTDDDVTPHRPQPVAGPPTEGALAVLAVREALLTGYAMPYKDGGHLR